MPRNVFHSVEIKLNEAELNLEEEKSITSIVLSPVPLAVARDKDEHPIGVTEATNGIEDEADIQLWKESITTRMKRLREHEEFFIKVMGYYESGDKDIVIALLRKRKNLPEFFLFVLDYLEDPKSRAKAGGVAKNAGLAPYVERAKREYSVEKKKAGKLKQMAFAIEFVEKMAANYASARIQLTKLNSDADALRTTLEAMDHKARRDSEEAKELKSIKEQIRVLERHPKPVTEDTVVSWLVGI